MSRSCAFLSATHRSIDSSARASSSSPSPNSRILGVHDRTILVRYRKPHSQRPRTLALEVMEFIRRFLQHVLPTGFMKIRYYGFMNPNCKVPLDRIRGLIELSYGFALDLPETPHHLCWLKMAKAVPPRGDKRRSQPS